MKYSIRRQISFIFIGLLVGAILLCWVINNKYLEKYYMTLKIDDIHEAYQLTKDASESGVLEDDAFVESINSFCSKNNISIMIMDMKSNVTICAGDEKDFMKSILFDLIFREEALSGNLETFESEDGSEYYVLQTFPDPRSKLNYLQMWGMFDSDHFFMLRSSVESIRESVAIANRFFAIVGMAVALLGGLIIFLITRKISEPILELSEISKRMTELDFNAKYTGKHKNEIATLGENINVLSNTLEKTISELKTANNELKRDIEQKEKADEIRKEFLSNVTHELKTPIALIQGYAEGLKDNVNDDPESRDMYCDVIIDESAKMNNMVKNLLNLNELENGYGTLNMIRFDICELIRNYLVSVDMLISQNEIKLINNCPESCYVWADEFMVEGVFGNYFTNAVHYATGEKNVNISLSDKEGKIRISVVNSGRPIPDENIEHIWEKFYKVDKARTREYGGSGVGLSVVKASMELMNEKFGVINYENAVEFWFELDKA